MHLKPISRELRRELYGRSRKKGRRFVLISKHTFHGGGGLQFLEADGVGFQASVTSFT